MRVKRTDGRRRERGAALLLALLVTIGLLGAGLLMYYEARLEAQTRALDREAGRLFAAWVLAAHRAGQTHDWRSRLASSAGAFTLTPGELRALGAAPPWWRGGVGRGVSFSVGLMDDGTGRGVAMAFGVLEAGSVRARSPARLGAVEAGLAGLAVAGGPATPMRAHEPLIEQALGEPLTPGALYVTADTGVHYRDRALYRRAQPGLAYLNRMETALDASLEDVTGAGALAGASLRAQTARIEGMAALDGGVEASGVEAASFAVGGLDATELTLSDGLTVGGLRALTIDAGAVNASGRVDARSFDTPGTLEAVRVSGVRVEIGGNTAVTVMLSGEMVDAGSTLEAVDIDVRGVSAPVGDVSGAMTVGSCSGC